ncbi:hypothetical protein WJX73_004568 [Symbiochloris irregularis]|uniref:Cytochrome P450 n=1 Tax=Symbiochloris irregularis TaxID=706552 RepID=A0AAW1NRM0_9CHLO
MILAWFLVLPLLAFVVYGFRPLDRWRLKHIPGPAQLWLVGNLPGFAKYGDFEFFHRLHKQYGNVFKVWALGNNVVAASPELCRQILLQNQLRFPVGNLFAGEMHEFESANILFHQKLDKVRAMRNAWHPMSYSGSLENFVGLMHRAADKAVQRLSAVIDSKEAINAHMVLSAMTIQVIAAAAFGVDVSDPDTVLRELNGTPYTVAELLKDMRMVFKVTNNPNCIYTQLGLLLPFAAPLWRLLANVFPNENHAKALDLRTRLVPFAKALVADQTAAVAEQDDTIKAFQPGGDGTKRKGVAAGSFIDILVRSKQHATMSLTDTEIANQVYLMLLAGFETTANALSFTVYCLAQHPDKAEKLAAEIHSQPENPDYTTLTEGFPYTDACIREGMRLYPPGTIVGRVAAKDMDLGGYKVPKGTNLIGPIYAIHHDESVWPQAEAFLPERHLSDDAVGAPTCPHAWLGFGEGARSCVGSRLALLEAKLALVHLFRNLSFRLTPGQVPLKLLATITLGPKEGVWVTVHERKAAANLAAEP